LLGVTERSLADHFRRAQAHELLASVLPPVPCSLLERSHERIAAWFGNEVADDRRLDIGFLATRQEGKRA
jgi:hypothetical protein